MENTRRFLQALFKLQRMQLNVKRGYTLDIYVTNQDYGRVITAWLHAAGRGDCRLIAHLECWEKYIDEGESKLAEFERIVNRAFNQNN